MKKSYIFTIISLLLSVACVGGIVKASKVLSEDVIEKENKVAMKEKILKLETKFFYENFEPETDSNGFDFHSGDIYFQVKNFYSNFKYEDIESTTLYYSSENDEKSFTKHDIRAIIQYEKGDYFNIYYGSHKYYVGNHYFKMSLKFKNYDMPLIAKGMIEIVEG